MPRRTATLLASTLTLIALLCVALLWRVPYAEMSPGPTVNTLGSHGGDPVLQISGHKTYPTSGHLNMTTVRVTSADYSMNLVEAVVGWLAHDQKVVEHDTLYPKGQTAEQADQENAEEFTQSQDSAKVAALDELGIPVGSRVIVSAVVKGAPAEGELHAGDVVKAVDGRAGEGGGRRRRAGHQAQGGAEGGVHRRAQGREGRRHPGRDHHHGEVGRRRRGPGGRGHPGRGRAHLPVQDRHQAGGRRRPEQPA